MSATGNHDAPKVRDAKGRRRFLNLEHKATHAVMVGDNDIAGVDQGFRCFRLVSVGRKWTHLIEVVPNADGEQRPRQCENELWTKLVRAGWALDEKGKKITNA